MQKPQRSNLLLTNYTDKKMSQSDSKSKGSSLLMPLAIGGGLLLLFMGMKKAKAEGSIPSLPGLPEMDSNQTTPQIVPETAPKYTDVVENEEEELVPSQSSYSPTSSSNQSTNYNALPSNPPEEEEEESNSSGGYQFNNSIPKSNSATKWNERQDNKIIGNGKPKLSTQAQANQARKFAERGGGILPKVTKLNAIRSASEQAKLAQQKARSNSPIKSPIPFISQAQKAIAQNKTAPKTFPLKQEQTNNYIKEVQRKLGVSPTGFFGTQTRAALLKKYKVTEVSEALYKQIISGKAPAAKPIIPIKKAAPIVKKPIKILRKK